MNWHQRAKDSHPEALAIEVSQDFQNGKDVEPFDLEKWGNEKIAQTGREPMLSTQHMKHRKFFESFAKLPNEVKKLARDNFIKMLNNPASVSLKRIPQNTSADVWSATVGRGYRALATKVGDKFVWYWIGPHQTYDRQLGAPTPAAHTMPPGVYQNFDKPKTPYQH